MSRIASQHGRPAASTASTAAASTATASTATLSMILINMPTYRYRIVSPVRGLSSPESLRNTKLTPSSSQLLIVLNVKREKGWLDKTTSRSQKGCQHRKSLLFINIQYFEFSPTTTLKNGSDNILV